DLRAGLAQSAFGNAGKVHELAVRKPAEIGTDRLAFISGGGGLPERHIDGIPRVGWGDWRGRRAPHLTFPRLHRTIGWKHCCRFGVYEIECLLHVAQLLRALRILGGPAHLGGDLPWPPPDFHPALPHVPP